MPDPPPYPDSDRDAVDDAGGGSDRGARAGTPRWVKVLGVIALVLVVLVVVMLVTGGRTHGPGRHAGSDDRDEQTAPSGVSEPGGRGHRPPGGHGP